MIFDVRNIDEAIGCYLAHSHRTSKGRIAKGTKLDAALAQELAASGISSVQVAQPETHDLHEDDAATALAHRLTGEGVTESRARTGRVNLHAAVTGLCVFDRATLISANAVDEGITITTLAENQWVASGRMVCTIKIIPYAVALSRIELVLDILTDSAIRVLAPKAHDSALIQTRLPSIKEQVLDKTLMVTQNRLHSRGLSLSGDIRCKHNTEELTNCILNTLQQSPDWILFVGASAISDRRDIIPAAIEAAGGTVDRYGIPVDPGNLLLIGHIGSTTLIGLPGCARSPRSNGLDLILDRLVCQLPISNEWLSSLAIGGLLTEIADRPAPRINADEEKPRQGIVGAVILAAGSSRRAGSINKLLFQYQQQALVSHVASMLQQSHVDKVIAVTGFESDLVEKALQPSGVSCQHNVAHASGMASSLVCGVSSLLNSDAIIVCLGDMPQIKPEIINSLIARYKATPEKSIFIPVHQGQRGNPVLFTSVFFDTLLSLEGDTGAKVLCRQYPDKVCEVEVKHPGILLDYDTRGELQSLAADTD